MLAIQGQELKYNKLCQALDVPIKVGNAKISQIDDLGMYCRLEQLSSPTRYVVQEVYDGALLAELNGNNKYQALFESALYRALIENGDSPLYLSNMETLELFEEVNENFKIACNRDVMAQLGEDYANFADMGQVAYKILKQWTRRRLEIMELRGIITTARGFRLYSESNGYIITTNVAIDSELERVCQEIYHRAVVEMMPIGWHGEWVGADRWRKFESKIKELVREQFDEDFYDLKPITIIFPPRKQYLIEVLDKMYADMPELALINNESCRKILETTQLDKYSESERKRLVNISIKQEPEIKLKKLLNKKESD